MKKQKRKKPRYIRMRFRKGDPAHNLLAATQHWVHANGGNLIVIGGISTIVMPEDREFCFRVAVGCMGRMPKKPESKDAALSSTK